MIREELLRIGQTELADTLVRVDPPTRRRVEAQLATLDLDRVGRLVADLVAADPDHEDLADLEPADVVPLGGDDAAAVARGEELLREGRVAAVLVAGGQGTRLGFNGPKGAFPVGAVTRRMLFDHHAGRIAAMRERYACELPWYVMTSPQNDAATREIFRENDWFGLPPGSVRLFVQGELPAVDRRTGAILREAPDRIALSPDGHGGIFPALVREGILDDMRDRGVTTFVTFNVDNPMLRVADPRLLGHHALAGAEMSNVVVRKHDPGERVGIVAKRADRAVLVEYSDLPDDVAGLRAPDGGLVFWAGSIAAHAIEREFAERVGAEGGLPYHRAVKAVPYVHASGETITPDEPNAVKFEAFMFDALPLAERTVSVEADRYEEFSPIKNAEGPDSPDTARRDLNRLYASWLNAAGVEIATDASGDPGVDIEIDPRFAIDADDLRRRLPKGYAPPPGEPILLA